LSWHEKKLLLTYKLSNNLTDAYHEYNMH
jgi:hypothetical protein